MNYPIKTREELEDIMDAVMETSTDLGPVVVVPVASLPGVNKDWIAETLIPHWEAQCEDKLLEYPEMSIVPCPNGCCVELVCFRSLDTEPLERLLRDLLDAEADLEDEPAEGEDDEDDL